MRLILNPFKEQRQNYNIANELENLVINKLKPGTTLKEEYDSGVEFVKNKKEELLSKLPPNLGFGVYKNFSTSF